MRCSLFLWNLDLFFLEREERVKREETIVRKLLVLRLPFPAETCARRIPSSKRWISNKRFGWCIRVWNAFGGVYSGMQGDLHEVHPELRALQQHVPGLERERRLAQRLRENAVQVLVIAPSPAELPTLSGEDY